MNKLKGRIEKISFFENLSFVEVKVGKEIFKSVVIETPETSPYLKIGNEVFLLFKETEVAVGKDCTGKISLSNQIPCKIKKIKKGKILTQITLSFEVFEINSIITTFSADKLSLKEGEDVIAFIKANEISLMEILHE